MIQFYAMPLTPFSHILMTRIVIASTGDAEKDTEGLQRIKQMMWTGNLRIEMSRGDWLEMQSAAEMWGMTSTDIADKADALRLVNDIDSVLCGEPSRVIDEAVKVPAPVERQGDLFDGAAG